MLCKRLGRGVWSGSNKYSRNFQQYEKLTKKSGLELNADKTEIISLHTERTLNYEVQYNGQTVKISTMKEIKICGTNKEREYELNITEKVEKLEHKIKMWKSRNQENKKSYL